MQEAINDDYHKWQQRSKERVFAMLEQVWARTRDVPDQEFEAEVVQAVAMLRQELREDLKKTDSNLSSER